jgi:hypothetical protein
MPVNKQDLLNLEQCNINLAALTVIREQLEKIKPSDAQTFNKHITKIEKLSREISDDEINLRDAYIEQLI